MIISPLIQNRRVFIDVRDMQNNEQLINSIRDEQERESFAHELADIMCEYPDSVKDEREKVVRILNRLAEALGLRQGLQPGWFTHISEQGALSMLSISKGDDHWYNLMACDNYLMVEHRDVICNILIRLSGSANCGKTQTIKKVYHALLTNYPDHAVELHPETSDDVKGVFFVGNAKVGIESQGDPWGRQVDRSIDEFVSIGCDFILVASRNRGMTVEAINKYRNVYEIAWMPKNVADMKDELACETINITQATDIIEFIQDMVKYCINED